MKKLRAYGRVVLASMKMAMQHNLIDGFIIFTIIVQPLLVAILALWMLRGKGADYAIYVVVGSGMSGLWSSLLFISGNSINVERWIGTLEIISSIPTPLSVVVFGKTLANVLQSVLSMVTTYILASLIFGYPLTIAMPGFFFASLVLTIFAFISFGLIIAPLFVINPQIQRWQNGLEFPVFVLSGFLFPIAMLPGWTTPISYALPTYWAAKALHASARATESIQSIMSCWLILLASSLVFFMLSASFFRLMIKKAKQDATLNMR